MTLIAGRLTAGTLGAVIVWLLFTAHDALLGLG